MMDRIAAYRIAARGRHRIAAHGRRRIVRSWGIFLEERFPPLVNVPFGLLLAGTAASAALSPGGWGTATALRACLLAAACLIFLFRLRILDEVKDYTVDSAVNPGRPLARGLISLRQARWAALCLGALELLATLPSGFPAVAAWAFAAGFTLLMYKEFFAGGLLQRSLLLYALVHAPAAALAALWIGCGVSGSWPWSLEPRLWWYAASLVPASLLYDVSRKTWEPGEEKEGRASYSRGAGIRGAARLCAVLVLACGFAMELALRAAGSPVSWKAGVAALAVLTAGAFCVSGKARMAQALGLAWIAALPLAILGGVII